MKTHNSVIHIEVRPEFDFSITITTVTQICWIFLAFLILPIYDTVTQVFSFSSPFRYIINTEINFKNIHLLILQLNNFKMLYSFNRDRSNFVTLALKVGTDRQITQVEMNFVNSKLLILIINP